MGLAPYAKGDFERAIRRDHSPTRLSEFSGFGKCSAPWNNGYLGPVRALVQRASEARVRVDGEVIGEIGPGLCCLVGVTHDDDADTVKKMASKLWNLRIFTDENNTNLGGRRARAPVVSSSPP